MKMLFVIATLFCVSLQAQGTFRIFDSQMNDVTSGVLYIADSNATQILCDLNVENIDSVTHNVTAGRMVLTAPATSSNAMIWGMNQYPPSSDSSVASEIIAPAGMQTFQGLYFPNNNGGTATINYCFWERTDMNNNSCVTVTYDNFYPAGIPMQSGAPVVSYGPNPATKHLMIAWDPGTCDRIDMYSSDGRLISSVSFATGVDTYEWELSNYPDGIYYIHCSNSSDGFGVNFTFIHTSQE